MGSPPLLDGADHATWAAALPAVATANRGCVGGVGTNAVKAALGTENWLVPKLLVLATRNRTGVPIGSPVIRAEFGGTPCPPGFTVKSGTAGVVPSEASTVRTMKPVKACPLDPGIQLTIALPVSAPPGVALEAVGPLGTAGGAPAGGWGVTFQIAPAPLSEPCVQSEPMKMVSLAKLLVSILTPSMKQNAPPNCGVTIMLLMSLTFPTLTVLPR